MTAAIEFHESVIAQAAFDAVVGRAPEFLIAC